MLSGILNSKTTILGDSMKKTIKLALGAAVLLSATSAFATNGDNMFKWCEITCNGWCWYR